jgi:hypothetical protein
MSNEMRTKAMNKAAGSRSSVGGKLFGRVGRNIAWLGLRMNGLTSILANRPANAYQYSTTEMWRLFKDMRARKPETVMEFGVGCSTLVIAAALKKNGRGRLITVDGSEEWLGVCRDAMPADLAPFVSFNHVPVEKLSDQHAHRYARLPEATLDYLFMDGPSIQHIPDWQGPPIAADPIVSNMKFNKGARIIVEGRTANVEYLKSRLGPSWRLEVLPVNWAIFDYQS